eukprot:4425736-Prymnesium_polylepis.1
MQSPVGPSAQPPRARARRRRRRRTALSSRAEPRSSPTAHQRSPWLTKAHAIHHSSPFSIPNHHSPLSIPNPHPPLSIPTRPRVIPTRPR